LQVATAREAKLFALKYQAKELAGDKPNCCANQHRDNNNQARVNQ